jgi:hypothetical protein
MLLLFPLVVQDTKHGHYSMVPPKPTFTQLSSRNGIFALVMLSFEHMVVK